MNKLITITSKGQTTLPAAMRRKLGIGPAGGALAIHFNERRGELIISKPASINELSQRISSYIKPNTAPLADVDDFYQRNRLAK